MQAPHPNEQMMSDREIELQRREAMLLKREAAYGEREKDFAPTVRLIMTIVAQAGGFLLLFILGTGILPATGRGNIAFGFDFIRDVAWYYVILSLAILLLSILLAAIAQKFKHGHTDFVLLLYVTIDILLLLMLVYQQGGICRSMFLPVFFLIPTAYLIVERREKRYRWRRIFILLVIVGCICCSYDVAKNFPPTEPGEIRNAVEGKVSFIIWSFPITDFETLSHETFDKGLFYVSLIAAFVPLFQISVIIIQERFRRGRGEFVTEIENPPLDSA